MAFGSIFLVFLMLAGLRWWPDRVIGADLLRALVVRTLVFGVAGALACTLVVAILNWRHIAINNRVLTITLAFLLSGTIQIALTLWLAHRYDKRLMAAADRVTSGSGLVEFSFAGGAPRTILPAPNGDYHIAEPLSAPTDLEIKIACAAEDERCADRLVNIDLRSYARAIWAMMPMPWRHESSERQGASNIGDQVGAKLLHIKPEGRGWPAYSAKLEKVLAGFRVDDIFDTRRRLSLYLSTAPFGTLHGHEVIGIVSAARVFYGREHSDLTLTQLTELMARLKNPAVYFPYGSNSAGETRVGKLRARAMAILAAAVRHGWVNPGQRDAALAAFPENLASPSEALARVELPRARALIAELYHRVPDVGDRHLDVEVAVDPHAQQILDRSTQAALASFSGRLPWKNHAGDPVMIDAVVVDPNSGAVLADRGLATIPGGQASQIKPEHYGLALETGVLPSLQTAFKGCRRPAEAALFHSDNACAIALAHLIGLGRVVGHLRSQGYSVLGAYDSVVIGAGVAGSVWLVAGNAVKYSYPRPGWRVEPSWLARVTDAASGQVLFEPLRQRVFSTANAVQLRCALEKVSTQGTAARALRSLANRGPIATKTGTAGFFRRGRWQGEGGSWTVAADRASGQVLAVRVRWSSGRPFELEGGQSAAHVVAAYFRELRVSHTGDQK